MGHHKKILTTSLNTNGGLATVEMTIALTGSINLTAYSFVL